jgi:hypothetical protein
MGLGEREMRNTWDPILETKLKDICDCGHYMSHHQDYTGKCLREGNSDRCQKFKKMDNLTYVVWVEEHRVK